MMLIGAMGPKKVYSACAPNGVNFHHTFRRVMPANEEVVAEASKASKATCACNLHIAIQLWNAFVA